MEEAAETGTELLTSGTCGAVSDTSRHAQAAAADSR